MAEQNALRTYNSDPTFATSKRARPPIAAMAEPPEGTQVNGTALAWLPDTDLELWADAGRDHYDGPFIPLAIAGLLAREGRRPYRLRLPPASDSYCNEGGP